MRILAVLLVACPLCAQSVSLGFRGGVPVTPLLNGGADRQSTAPPYLIGPLVELALSGRLAAEGEILVRHTRLAPTDAPRAGIWGWEAPFTLAYRIRSPQGLFLRAGFCLNGIFSIRGAAACARGPFGEQFYCLDGRSLFELRHRRTDGFVAGGGPRIELKHLRLEPEVRFTHWFDRNFGVRDSAVRSNLNQVELLMGVIF